MAGAAEVPVGAMVPEDWLELGAGEVDMATWEERGLGVGGRPGRS